MLLRRSCYYEHFHNVQILQQSDSWAPFIIDKNEGGKEEGRDGGREKGREGGEEGGREGEREKEGVVGNNKEGECPIIMASKLGYVPESVTFA